LIYYLLEIPRELEINFNNNVESIEKIQAITSRTKEIVNKIDSSNNLEMNEIEIFARDSIRKVSNHESYYEFNNDQNINQNSDKGNNYIARINNESVRNEENHKMVQSPTNNNRNSLLHSNLNMELGKLSPLFIFIF